MRQKRSAGTGGGEKTIRDIRRATRRQYSAEEKIRIVLDGLARRGQHRRAVPPGRYQPEPLLPLVEGVSGGRHEAACGRHRAGGLWHAASSTSAAAVSRDAGPSPTPSRSSRVLNQFGILTPRGPEMLAVPRPMAPVLGEAHHAIAAGVAEVPTDRRAMPGVALALACCINTAPDH